MHSVLALTLATESCPHADHDRPDPAAVADWRRTISLVPSG
jgi:hypothetical protein